MRTRKHYRTTGAVFWLFGTALFVMSFSLSTACQSTDQTYPTAVSENELSGKIKARDIGDSRLTTYYYTFNAKQGDLFVNVVTKNLNGSINLFAADGLRPLGQILVYADLSSSETGRVVYFRKPEKLILRVEGRTPNDDPAEFQIKFAGSFEAVAPTDVPEPPKVTAASAENDTGVRVNSVGTIVEVVPKAKPIPRAATEAEKSAEKIETESTSENEAKTTESKPETEKAVAEKSATEDKAANEEKSVAENKPSEEKPKTTVAKTAVRRTPRLGSSKKTAPSATNEETKISDSATESEPKEKPKERTSSAAPRPSRKTRVVVTDNIPPPKPDPMANISLVILFKDGTKVERPMNEVLRFSVDRGILTVISKDGTTAKYSILDVTNVTIQNP